MNAASVAGKRAAQASFAVAGIVPVAAGLWGVFHPFAGSVGSLLNHGRYLSGLLLAIGLTFWAAIPDIERRTTCIRVLTGVVVIGGVCRLLGVMMGDPLSPSVAGALAMELCVTPSLCFWQSRLVPRGQRKTEADEPPPVFSDPIRSYFFISGQPPSAIGRKASAAGMTARCL